MRGAVSLLFTAAAAALLSACPHTEPEPTTPDAMPDSKPPVDGTASFNEKIRPLVRGCLNCHAVGLNMPNITSFNGLEAKYKVKPGRTNILVTKADNSNGQHYGVAYFDVDGKKIVAEWIDSLP